MARTSSKRAALAVASLTLGMVLAGMPAQGHTPEAAGWLQQVGDTAGASKPVINGLNIGTVLYSANRFTPPGTGSVQRSTTKWLAWGTKPVTGGHQLYVTRSGPTLDNGTNVDNSAGVKWTTPQPVVLHDPNGVSVPFIIDNADAFEVVFTTFVDQPFLIYYKTPASTGTTASSFSQAISNEGVEWYFDGGIVEDGVGSVVGGAPYKAKLVNPSDVIYNATGSTTNATCFAAPSPYGTGCRFIMFYTTEDAAGNRYTAMARSGDGFTFRGNAAPVLSPGTAGSWDDSKAGNLVIQQLSPSSFRGLYSGGRATGGNSIGWVDSTDGVTFTKASTNPVTTATMFDVAAIPAGASSLIKAQFLADGMGHHTRAYTTRLRGTAGDTYLALTSPAPGTAPSILVSSPSDSQVMGPTVPISLYLGDTLGTTPGLDMTTLSVTVDGVSGAAITFEDTIVGQFTRAGKKISGLVTLADGAHTISVSIADLDGEVSSTTLNFDVDGLAPNTTLTSAPTGVEIGLVDSAGTYRATVVDPVGGTGLDYVSAVVTNPLGQIKRYSTHAAYGWQITRNSASNWTVAWVAPTLDAHFAVPGTYTVSLLGTDLGGNAESADAANTTQVLVL